MGQLNVPPSGIVYVDANVVIYRVERIEPFRDQRPRLPPDSRANGRIAQSGRRFS
jgi:hypothetical protein